MPKQQQNKKQPQQKKSPKGNKTMSLLKRIAKIDNLPKDVREEIEAYKHSAKFFGSGSVCLQNHLPAGALKAAAIANRSQVSGARG